MPIKKKQGTKGKTKKGSGERISRLSEETIKSKHLSSKSGKRSLVLRRSGDKELSMILENTPSGLDQIETIISLVSEPMVVLDFNLQVVTANLPFCHNYNIDPEKIKGALFYQIANGLWDILELRAKLEQILYENKTFADLELRLKLTHHKEIRVRLDGRIINDQNKKPQFIVLVVTDATGAVKSAESTENFYSFPEVNPMPVVETDQAGKVLHMNPAAKKLFPDLSTPGIKHPFLAGLPSAINELKETKKEWLRRQVKAEGKWYGQTIYPVENGSRIRIYSVDITDAIWVRQILQASERKFKSIYAESPIGIELYDVDGKLVEANKAYLDIFGVSDVTEVKEFNLFEDPRLSVGDKKKLKEGKTVRYEGPFDFEKVKEHKLYPTSKTGMIYLDMVISPLATGGEESQKGYLVQVQDITERKRLEEELKKANEELEERVRKRTEEVVAERQRLYSVLETLPAYVLLLDKDYHVPFANKFFRERFGESHGKYCYEYLFDRSEPCENCETYKVLKTKQPHHWEWTGPDGRNYDIYDYPFVEADGSTLILEMGIDITQRKKAEEELRQHKEHLEELVNERTGELETRNLQLAAEITERKRAEEELRQTRDYLENLFNYANAPIICWDSEFKITRFNHAFEHLTDYQAEDVLGKDLSILFPPESREESLKKIRHTLRGEYWEVVEIPILRKTGDIRIALWNSANVYADDGKTLLATIAQGQDITDRKQAEEKLQKQAVMLANVSEAIMGFGPDMKIDFWSPSAERLYGYTSAEALGHQASELLRAVYLGITREEAVVRLMKTGKLIVENIHHTKDGRALHVEYHATGMYNQQNVLTGIVAIIHDITERKKVEEVLRQTRDYLENLFNYANAPIICWDVNFKITRFNHAFEHLTDYKTEEVLGKDLNILFPEESREESLHKIKKTLSGEYWKVVEIPILRKDGDIRIALWNSANVYAEDGKTLLATIAQGQDITERKQNEEEIRALNEYLRQHEAELAASNKELEAFSYSVSHDLRAPLRNINGFSQALLEDYSSRLDEKGKDYLKRVRAATQRMGGLIDDLLQLSLTMRKEMQREMVDLSRLANSIIDDLKEAEPVRQVEVAIQEKAQVSGDARLLREMLVNLLGNAWKFTSQRSPAKIEFGYTEKDGEKLFFVKDNGAGFDMKYVDKLFIPFQRLHSADEFSGNGIGLAIVKRIIERHGGSIWAEGETEKGATFYFKL